MATNSDLIVTGLDFDTIRANLRNYIASKPEFSDYDFTDSALGTLLDLLAYNTYYQAFYTNMASNEAFLDTAQLYDNVVSNAKVLGYTPTSARGAQANVKLIFTNSTSNSTFRSITVPKDTRFSSTINGTSYTFVTPQTYTITANTTGGFADFITIAEGEPLTHRFLFNRISNTSFVLPNEMVDTTSIAVSVITGGNTETYVKADDIMGVNSSSKIFFVEGDRNKRYKIAFGDGVIGRLPVTSSVVSVSYRVCNGELGNGANNFSLVNTTVDGQTGITIIPIGRASGGAEIENIEKIRQNAPRDYETQNRAVIASDYERIMLRDNPDVQALSVWGGEENDPPIYGKVYVCAKPKVGNLFSTARKDQIKKALKRYNVQSIDIEMVDPTYLYILPTVTVRYNPTTTTLTPGEIASRVASRIISYEHEFLNNFGRKFRYSKFLNYIDQADAGIVSSMASIRMKKVFIPSLTTPSSYVLKFNQPIQGLGGYINGIPENISLGSLTSSSFTYQGYPNCYFDDNGYGTLEIYYPNSSEETAEVLQREYLTFNAGSVNYEQGVVTIPNFLPSEFTGDAMSIVCAPTSFNISPIRNQILLIDQSTIEVVDDITGIAVARVSNVETIGRTESSVVPGGRLNNF